MLSLRILNGVRNGKILTLEDIFSDKKELIGIGEDESLKFSYKINEDFDQINIILHENIIAFTKKYQIDNLWYYEWEPKNSFGYLECIFQNFCGIAELQLELICFKNNITKIIPFQPLEVLTKKIDADRIYNMLNYLSENKFFELSALVKVTKLHIDFKEGPRDIDFFLDKIDNNIKQLEINLIKIFKNPIHKYSQIGVINSSNNDAMIDDRVIAWLNHNTDLVYEYSNEESLFDVDETYFNAHNILGFHSVKDTNVYENQTIIGFVFLMILMVKKIINKINDNDGDINIINHIDGYLSFYSFINKLNKSINQPKILWANKLLNKLNQTYKLLQKLIPVKELNFELPNFTHKVKRNIYYQNIFKSAINWHKLGTPDWGNNTFLNSIRDIPKLFEYYLLSLIINHFNNLCTFTKSYDNIYEFTVENKVLKIYYEPKIWMTNHHLSKSSPLLNVEEWSIFNNFDLKKKIHYRQYSNRSPDIIIELIDFDLKSKFFIIDAKYSKSEKAFVKYLPELIVKYLHGIHVKSDKSKISGLMIVNPNDKSFTRHYHQDEFSIYGENPIEPALLVSSIDVSSAHLSDSNIKNNLNQIFNLLNNF